MNSAETVLTRMLIDVLEDASDRLALIKRFQEIVWNTAAFKNEEACGGILRDLANDLDYYEPDPLMREKDPSFYGDDRLEQEVRTALERLKDLQTESPGPQ
jgi:hypothetical protein